VLSAKVQRLREKA